MFPLVGVWELAHFWISKEIVSILAVASSIAVDTSLLIARFLIPESCAFAHARIPTAMITAAIRSSTRVKPLSLFLQDIAQPNLGMYFIVLKSWWQVRSLNLSIVPRKNKVF